MDTIARENNSYLPVAGVIVGVLALVLSVVALAKISSAKKEISVQVEPLSARIEDAVTQSGNAAAAADRVKTSLNSLANDTNVAFGQVAEQLTNIRGEITKVQEAKVAPTKAAGKTAAGPVTAGPDEYIVKGGDTGYKIAQAVGVSWSDLQAVNSGVTWTALKPGQKIKLPAKK